MLDINEALCQYVRESIKEFAEFDLTDPDQIFMALKEDLTDRIEAILESELENV